MWSWMNRMFNQSPSTEWNGSAAASVNGLTDADLLPLFRD